MVSHYIYQQRPGTPTLSSVIRSGWMIWLTHANSLWRRMSVKVTKSAATQPVVQQPVQVTNKEIEMLRITGVLWAESISRKASNAKNFAISWRVHSLEKRKPLWWRHNELDGVSAHRCIDCLLNRLVRRRSKKSSKLRVTGLCEGNSPVTGEFPAQRASDAENVPIWWRHHALVTYTDDDGERQDDEEDDGGDGGVDPGLDRTSTTVTRACGAVLRLFITYLISAYWGLKMN